MSVQLAKRLDVDMNGDAPEGPSIAAPTLDAMPDLERVPVASSHAHLGRWLLAIVLLAAAGAGGAWYKYVYLRTATRGKQAVGQRGQDQGKATLGFVDAPAKNNRGAAAPCPVVQVELVPRCDILRLTGSLMADEKSAVASNTSGIAAEVRVDRGSLVPRATFWCNSTPRTPRTN